jgi:hypothetical protein
LLPALTNVLAHAREFYLGVVAPHGWTKGSSAGAGDGSFLWCEQGLLLLLCAYGPRFLAHQYLIAGCDVRRDEEDGGSQEASKYVDISTLKFLYPTDARVDFVFRTAIANYSRLNDFNIRFPCVHLPT